MTKLGRNLDRLLGFFAAIAGVLLVVMMLATVVKVAMRAALNQGILGIDQISGTMMVYITFLAAAWVLRKEEHVSVEIFVSWLRPAYGRWLQVASSLIGAAACLSLAYFSTKAVLLSLHRGIVVAAELEIPRAINLGVIPLGCFILGIEFLRRAVRFYTGHNPVHHPEDLRI
ncbi:TRAP transporter small permease [Afifella sp. IM 167]|uniref:TRAP transporter small permease n=1 Tax=Afifella sp. IM 167 TaxID=2033586 RepID=UPI001CCFFA09|nr:TRAP transporter small permease subunit [Afifella sp. IM 167]MBZ8134767.1 hypothetical protein [Afifella sp. IM 167]